MLVGYARICPFDPSSAPQVASLQGAGCVATFVDVVMPNANCEDVGLAAARAFVRQGDTLVVCRLDRLGRSLPQLVDLVEHLHRREVGFKSLAEGVDTSSGDGQSPASLFVALAEVERSLLRERTLIALEAARADGRRGGRPRSLTHQQAVVAQALYDDPSNRIEDICRALRISPKTLYRYVSAGKRRLWQFRPTDAEAGLAAG